MTSASPDQPMTQGEAAKVASPAPSGAKHLSEEAKASLEKLKKGGKATKDPAPESRASKVAAAVRAAMKDDEAIQLISREQVRKIKAISTGSLGLDLAIGIGGLPQGRIVEIYGPESSGKTTLSLQAVAAAQQAGGLVSYIDAEHALDLNYAANLGVDTESMLLSQPSCGEEALNIAEVIVGQGQPGDLVVVDSVAALVPKAELDGDVGDSHMGLQARIMGQALRKITGTAHERGVTVIFINQLRMKIGVMFGNPEVTSGGNALKFYASVRLDIRRIAAIKDGEDVIGNRTRVKVVKNKVSPPFKEVEFDIRYGTGVDYRSEMLEIGERLGLIEKSGSWHSFKGERIANGKEATIQALIAHPELDQKIYKAVREAAFKTS